MKVLLACSLLVLITPSSAFLGIIINWPIWPWNPSPPPPPAPVYDNGWDGDLRKTCGSDQAFNHILSVHNNGKEDRLWRFDCSNDVGKIGASTYHNEVNGWDAQFYFKCPSGSVIRGAKSYHWNWKEDRRWSYWCGKHTTSYLSHKNCAWSNWLNNHDAKIDYTVPSGKTLAGLGGYHWNWTEDRRWKAYICDVGCGPGFQKSKSTCICGSGKVIVGNSCKDPKSCSWGEYQTRAPTTTTDRQCTSCPLGEYQDSSSHTRTSCKDCPAGQYQNQRGKTGCKNCPSTQYQNQKGQSGCKNCQSGYYRSSSSSQTKCQTGFKCPGSCSREQCPKGTYQDQTGRTTCKDCPSNRYQNQAGQSGCKSCTSGWYRYTASEQRICPKGYRCSSCSRTLCTGDNYQDQEGKTGCKSSSKCGKGQYQYKAVTSTSPRECRDCRLNVNYQDSSSHTRTRCKPVTTCSAGTKVTSNPTISSDRVCTPCVNSFSVSTNARQCTSYTPCGTGQYLYASGTDTSNHDCRDCNPGVTYQDRSSHTETKCKPVTPQCGAGTFEKARPTLSSNRVCQQCPDGTYSSTTDSLKCEKWSVCPAGYEQKQAPSKTRDRTCQPCNGVTEYQDLEGQTQCKPVRTCSSDEYETVSPSPLRNRQCAKCTSSCNDGEVLVGTCSSTSNRRCVRCHPSCKTCSGIGEDQCKTCQSGKTLTNGRCVDTCGPREYQTSNGCAKCHSSCYHCTGPSANQCVACTVPNFLSGTRCLTTCPQNTYKLQRPNDNQCKDCSVCDSGKYRSGGCVNSQDSICTAWSTCAKGQKESVKPTGLQDRKCVNCDVGTEYQDEAGKLFCKPTTICPAGTEVSVLPTRIRDRSCSACTQGHFSRGENNDDCSPCPAGTYQDTTGSSSCKECGPEHYQSRQGQSKCLDIPSGSYGIGGSSNTHTDIKQCQPGTFCSGGSAGPTPCPPNQFQDVAGQSSCKTVSSCTGGSQEIAPATPTSDRVCGSCTDGQYYDTNQRKCIDWTVCDPGTHVSVQGTKTADRQCAPCDDDEFSTKPNQNKCTKHSVCPAGQEEVKAGTDISDVQCRSCIVGVSFKDSSGPDACKPVSTCDAGTVQQTAPTTTSDRKCKPCSPPETYQNKPGQVSCKAVSKCKAGEYAAIDPSALNDRQCDPCPDGQFRTEGSHTFDHCNKFKDCEPGTFISKEGTATSDRVCKPCEEEHHQPLSNQPSCIRNTVCTFGEHMIADATHETDRQCGKCGTNEYMGEAAHINTKCITATECGVGEYEKEAPTNAVDRICDICDGETGYQDLAKQTSCKPVTECKETEYEFTQPTRTTDRVCLTCVTADECNPSEYLDGQCGGDSGREMTRCAACHPSCASCSGHGDDKCLTCPSSRHFRNGKCVDDCPAGEYEANGFCKNCHSDCAECNGPNADQCTACSNDKVLSNNQCLKQCPANTFNENGQCVECTVCEDDTWSKVPCSPTADTQCVAWTECKVGEREVKKGTRTTDRDCESCEIGTGYQPHPEKDFCFPVSTCQPPNVETRGPTTSTDRVCSCDRQSCGATVTLLFEELVCREPNDAELKNFIDDCCSGRSEQLIAQSIVLTSAFEDRHTCEGCLPDTCECSKGYQLVHKDALDADVCEACDGVNNHSPEDGATGCIAITKCHQGQEELVKPTISTDRVCGFCKAGFIDDDRDGSTACKQCEFGTYVVPGSFGECSKYKCDPGTADLDNDPSTPCQPCAEGASYQDEAGKTTCKPVTDCEAGYEEVAPPTIQADRVCRECSAGFFKDKPGEAHTCEPVTDCAPGEEETSAPSISADRVCTECDEGFYKPEEGQSTRCRKISTCIAGEEEIRSPTPSSDTVCRSCKLGTTFKEQPGSGTCDIVSTCTPDQYMSKKATLTSDAVCSAFTECEEDEYQSRAPTLETDRVCSKCSSCPAGRFIIRECNEVENTECAGCKQCAPYQFRETACTVDSDTVCVDCKECGALQFQSKPCTSDDDAECQDLTQCDYDTQYQSVAPTKTSDRQCAPLTECKSDEYAFRQKTTTSDRVCRKITQCTPGHEEEKAPSAINDRVCRPCPPTTTDADENGATDCIPCNPGSYVPQGSMGNCALHVCGAGQADVDMDTSTPCEYCELGKSYAPQPGMTECLSVHECEAGEEEFVPPTLYSSRICVSCIEGRTFKEDAGQDSKCQAATTCGPQQFMVEDATLTSDRVCQDVTQCNMTIEYISTERTDTSDRACATLRECEYFEFESLAATATSNRVCKNFTVCDPLSEYELQAPTPYSDRVCSPFTTCAEDEVPIAEPTATSDRICSSFWDLFVHFPGDYMQMAGTADKRGNFTQDIISSLASLQINPASIYSVQIDPGSIVLTIRFLDLSSFEDASAALLNGDFTVGKLVATPCPRDYYLTSTYTFSGPVLTCEKYTDCDRDEFESTPATLTSDRDCSYVTICPPGQEEAIPPTLTSDRVCDTAQETSSGNTMSTGLIAIIAICSLLVIILIIALVVWRKRKATKDQRQEELVARLGVALGGDADADIANGNRLLRQLSTKTNTGQFFDNPTFQHPGAVLADEPWYVGVMDRQGAEDYIRSQGGQSGDFVVRESATKGTHVLSVMVDDSTFEHHKLYPDARGNYLLNGNKLSKDCSSLPEVVQHLSEVADGITVKLNLPEGSFANGDSYGPVARNDDYYGSVQAKDAEQDFYGGVSKPRPSWLRGQMSRQEAEAELAEDLTPGNFLVRESKNRAGAFAISLVIDDGRVEHHSLQQDGNGIFLLNNRRMGQPCTTLEDAIAHLQTNIESMSCTLGDTDIPVIDNGYADLPEFDNAEPVSFSNPNYRGSSIRRGMQQADGGYFDPAPGSVNQEPATHLSNPSYFDPVVNQDADTGYREPDFVAPPRPATAKPGYLDPSESNLSDSPPPRPANPKPFEAPPRPGGPKPDVPVAHSGYDNYSSLPSDGEYRDLAPVAAPDENTYSTLGATNTNSSV